LIEIGPGKGALTKKILNLSSQTLLIEYDQKMVEYLETKIFPSLDTSPLLCTQDILQRDENNIEHFPFCVCDDRQKSTTLVVGNLPYYITSPILRKFFTSTIPTRAG
jgi:16S rRNA (adenine1518-N6/adenine1519-N6)-dimethyltransferase